MTPPRQRRWLWLVVAGALLAAAVIGWLALRGPRVDGLPLRYAPLVRTLQFSARVSTLSRVDVGPTVNLHDHMIGVRGGLLEGVVESIIRVDARGALT